MMIALRRHRHQLPADQFNTLFFRDYASRNHGLNIGSRKTPPQQAFGGPRRLSAVKLTVVKCVSHHL